MLNIASLFSAATVADSLDYAIERDAQNGRINGQFLNLMATCYGAELPASPVAFVKAINDYRNSPTMPRFASGIGAVKGARIVHAALASLVDVLAQAQSVKGLPALAPMPKWLEPKAPKAPKAKAAPVDADADTQDADTQDAAPTAPAAAAAAPADDMLANRDTIMRQAIALVLGGHATAAQKAALQSALDRSTATAPAEAKQAKRKGFAATQKAIDAKAKAELTERASATVKAVKAPKAKTPTADTAAPADTAAVAQ